MKVDMVMPQMGESIAEATISKWLKKVGDAVEKDQVILEISTDKVDSEIPAPASGVITELLFNEGDVVPVKTKIAVIDSSGSAAAPSASAPSSTSGHSNGAHAPAIPVPAPATSTSSASMAVSSTAPSGGGNQFFSPLVMSLAEKHGVSLSELSSIQGSGEGGRVNKKDLLAFVEARSSRSTAPSTPPASSSSAATSSGGSSARAASPASSLDWGADGTKVIPMDTMRQAIADHMVRSKHTSPHVYSMQEVDMTAVSKWRKAHQDEFLKSEGFKLSFTPFFLEAAVRCLQRFPLINASIDGKKILVKKHINLGCAVAIGDAEKGFGLIVPVIKHAEERNLVGLARSLNELALKARSKKLLPDDVSGGTFTITNPGVFGTIIGTPIINQPQVAILCLGAIVKRPVVIDDMIAIREMCYLTLSYDHRLVDGALGGSFLAAIRDYLEGWDSKRSLY
jgi:2-oxoglutarate dehydrogenase E2 component (dihydrolipoamide succinyltransferase)